MLEKKEGKSETVTLVSASLASVNWPRIRCLIRQQCTSFEGLHHFERTSMQGRPSGL